MKEFFMKAKKKLKIALRELLNFCTAHMSAAWAKASIYESWPVIGPLMNTFLSLRVICSPSRSSPSTRLVSLRSRSRRPTHRRPGAATRGMPRRTPCQARGQRAGSSRSTSGSFDASRTRACRCRCALNHLPSRCHPMTCRYLGASVRGHRSRCRFFSDAPRHGRTHRHSTCRCWP